SIAAAPPWTAPDRRSRSRAAEYWYRARSSARPTPVFPSAFDMVTDAFADGAVVVLVRCSRYRIISQRTEQYVHRAITRNDEIALLHLDKGDAVARMKPKLLPDFRGDRRLALARNSCFYAHGKDDPISPYIVEECRDNCKLLRA